MAYGEHAAVPELVVREVELGQRQACGRARRQGLDEQPEAGARAWLGLGLG